MNHIKKLFPVALSMTLLLSSSAVLADGRDDGDKGDRGDVHTALVVTASNNATANQLMVYDASGHLMQTLPTGGAGGASGNAGGVTSQDDMVGVVNFGSQTVSLFHRKSNLLDLVQQFSTVSKPLSVAFGNDHVYVLGLTTIESHKMNGDHVVPTPDGTATLVKADGSAAQVGVLKKELIITEKSGTIETVNLDNDAVVGTTSAITIPAGSDAPFGLFTRGTIGYVTIAHSDEIAVITHDTVTSIVPSVTQHAPCWLTLSGSYLYSSNSPSKSVSLYTVNGLNLTQTIPVAASLTGSPTDIASNHSMLAVIDGSSHLSLFTIGNSGSLTPIASPSTGVATNGVAIVG